MAEKPIIITAEDIRTKGIGASPHVGFGTVRNLDIEYVDGAIRVSTAATKMSSTTVTDLIRGFAIANNSHLFAHGDTKKIYKSTDAGATWSNITDAGNSSGQGQGIIFWKDYIIVVADTALDAYGKISGTPDWTSGASGGFPNFAPTALQSISDHPTIVGQDDIVYIGNGRYVASMREISNFVPATSSTFSFNAQAIDLPEDWYVTAMEELGQNLMIGAHYNLSSTGKSKQVAIFPWDRTSSSFTIPIQIPGVEEVSAMKSHGGLCYILARGEEGGLYVTNGREMQLIRRFNFLTVQVGEGTKFRHRAIMIHRDKLFFGMGNTSANGTNPCGVYSYNPKTGAILLENIISAGTDGSSGTQVDIGALFSQAGNSYLIGWRNASTYGIDQAPNNTLLTSYGAYFDTPFMRLGTTTRPRTLSSIEVLLARALRAGEGIKIEYRESLDASFTSLDTHDFATHGAISSYIVDFSGTKEQLQLRVYLTTGGVANNGTVSSPTASSTSPELTQIMIY